MAPILPRLFYHQTDISHFGKEIINFGVFFHPLYVRKGCPELRKIKRSKKYKFPTIFFVISAKNAIRVCQFSTKSSEKGRETVKIYYFIIFYFIFILWNPKKQNKTEEMLKKMSKKQGSRLVFLVSFKGW